MSDLQKPLVGSLDGTVLGKTLSEMPGVMVRQKLQVFEQFCPACEKQNFYRIGAAGSEEFNSLPDGKEFKNMTPVFVGQEDSSCCCRFFCGNMRTFEMLVSTATGPDSAGEPLLHLERPFKCTCCFFGSICNPQELTISTPDGKLLGMVKQDWNCGRCCELFCFPGGYSYYAIMGAAGDTQFYMRHKSPSCCNGCANACAPTCCNKVFSVDVLAADGKTVISQLKNVFPGVNCRCIADASNYLMEFPPNATSEQKALLLGSLFLIEYIHFEKNEDSLNDDI